MNGSTRVSWIVSVGLNGSCWASRFEVRLGRVRLVSWNRQVSSLNSVRSRCDRVRSIRLIRVSSVELVWLDRPSPFSRVGPFGGIDRTGLSGLNT